MPCRNDFVSVTPLQIDLTQYAQLDTLRAMARPILPVPIQPGRSRRIRRPLAGAADQSARIR